MSKRAIVILYEGSKPSKGTVAALHAALCESGVVSDIERIEIYDMSEEEIIAAIAVKPMCGDSTVDVKDVREPITPEAKAVIVISQRFGETIAKEDYNELLLKIAMQAQRSKLIQTDQELDNAITTLADPTCYSHLKFKTKREAQIWDGILEIIRRVYHSMYV